MEIVGLGRSALTRQGERGTRVAGRAGDPTGIPPLEVASTVPEFTVSVPALGGRWLVGVIFLVHITTVALLIGIAMVAPVAEVIGWRRGYERWGDLARQLSTVLERLYAWGATWATFGLVAIWGLYPRLWGYLTSLFFYPVVIIAGVLWLLMTITAYAYYGTWNSLRGRRGLHNAIGWTFALSAMAFITLIVMFSSHQLTPAGGVDQLWAAAFNPSWLAETLHRHVGNLSYGPLVLGALVGAGLLVFRGRFRPSEGQRDYRYWVLEATLLLGGLVTLTQPLFGWYYVRRILEASPGAWFNMMAGAKGWLFLIQIGLLGAIFFLISLYLVVSLPTPTDGARRVRTRTWLRWSLLVLALALLLAVIPKELPLGQMRPWKYIALYVFGLVTIANLVLYWRERRQGGPVPGGWQRPAVLVALGLAAVAIFVTMGIIRESARGDWLIYQKMPPEQAQELVRP